MPTDAEVLSSRARIQAQVCSPQSLEVYEESTPLIDGPTSYPRPCRSPPVLGQYILITDMVDFWVSDCCVPTETWAYASQGSDCCSAIYKLSDPGQDTELFLTRL